MAFAGDGVAPIDGQRMRLWLLGTGTPTPSVRRMCSGYLVEVGGDFIVFDHGFGAHHRLLELGIAATQISHAFFSHHHYDHIGDYPRLLLTRWDQAAGSVRELEVYGPPTRLAEVETEAEASGLRTRRTGTSISILGIDGKGRNEGVRRPSNREDVFVLLTGEEMS